MVNSQVNRAAWNVAQEQGSDAVYDLVVSVIQKSVGRVLDAESMQKLNAEQITLWAYDVVHSEVLDGGFVQLIHNGYGPFIFDNPFAKAMRLWGLKEFSKLIYAAKKQYDQDKDEIMRECSAEEFMAMFERFPKYDDLDDQYIESEEEYTHQIVDYITENVSSFIEVVD